MKLDENKHDHKLTNWLKVGIFALLMLAPMFASISQTLYVTFNKNAYQSYNDKYVSSITEITSYTQFQQNLEYLVAYKENSSASSQDITIYYTNINIDWTNYGLTDIEYDSFAILLNNKIRAYSKADHTIYYDTPNSIWGNTLNHIYFTFSQYTNQNRFNLANTQYNLITYTTDKLDNAFYYGVDQMTKSDLFNWTQNTALYSGINAMTTQLEIQTPAIAILLTYWFILTIIYVIIDIVLKGFTLLTHIFSNKV